MIGKIHFFTIALVFGASLIAMNNRLVKFNPNTMGNNSTCPLDSIALELKKDSIEHENKNFLCPDSNFYDSKNKFHNLIVKKDFTNKELKKHFTSNVTKISAQELVGKKIEFAYKDAFDYLNQNLNFEDLNEKKMCDIIQTFLNIGSLHDINNPNSCISQCLNSKESFQKLSKNIDKAISNNPTFDEKNSEANDKKWRMRECLRWGLTNWYQTNKQNKEWYGKDYETPLPKVTFSIVKEKKENAHEFSIYSCNQDRNEDKEYMKKYFEEKNKKEREKSENDIFNRIANWGNYWESATLGSFLIRLKLDVGTSGFSTIGSLLNYIDADL